MKNLIVLAVLSLCAGAALAIPPADLPAKPISPLVPIVPPLPPPAPTLTQDLEQLLLLVPLRPLLDVATRYLLNDAQFQAVVRTLNSQDAFVARMRFRSQPEVIQFNMWTRTQMLLSGGPLEAEESGEIGFFNPTPFWATSVFGWQGFLSESLAYYPLDLIRAHIDAKVLENGIFAQFWARVKALKPVYERVLTFPETQRLVAQLQANGVDVNQLDQLIRQQFDWLQVVAPSAAPAGPTAAAPVPVPAGPVAPVLA